MEEQYADIWEGSTSLILAEYQRQSDVHLQAADWLDRKAFGLLGLSSIMVTFAMAVGGPLLLTQIGMALYAVIMATCFVVIFPRSYELPITINWDELCGFYLLKEPHFALIQLLSQYIKVIESNKIIINDKSKWLRYGLFLFIGLVVVSLIATYMGFAQ